MTSVYCSMVLIQTKVLIVIVITLVFQYMWWLPSIKHKGLKIDNKKFWCVVDTLINFNNMAVILKSMLYWCACSSFKNKILNELTWWSFRKTIKFYVKLNIFLIGRCTSIKAIRRYPRSSSKRGIQIFHLYFNLEHQFN